MLPWILSVVPVLFAFLPGLGKHKKRKWGRFLSASYSSCPLERPYLWPGHRPPTKGSAKYTSFDVLSSPIHLPRSIHLIHEPSPRFEKQGALKSAPAARTPQSELSKMPPATTSVLAHYACNIYRYTSAAICDINHSVMRDQLGLSRYPGSPFSPCCHLVETNLIPDKHQCHSCVWYICRDTLSGVPRNFFDKKTLKNLPVTSVYICLSICQSSSCHFSAPVQATASKVSPRAFAPAQMWASSTWWLIAMCALKREEYHFWQPSSQELHKGCGGNKEHKEAQIELLPAAFIQIVLHVLRAYNGTWFTYFPHLNMLNYQP